MSDIEPPKRIDRKDRWVALIALFVILPPVITWVSINRWDMTFMQAGLAGMGITMAVAFGANWVMDFLGSAKKP